MAAHPLGGVDSSNPHCWRGWRLHHYGGYGASLGGSLCNTSKK